ncbi:uncharacterized protein LOC129582161 [Paramacrobiotus metropolitanus]|uniref:uncharacterized protein LOC129582161 n=1 Tax=Paramacrobiotus metropolitanus TaxID=2943436 RepID=UPI00244597B9|nr:uncharacterized protein LOC129582161 [Paramacrobiotus metropolitanus]
MAASHIPVVDFQTFNDPATRSTLSQQLVDAFCSTGFVYLRNHGIDQELIESAFSSSKEFFTSPIDEKVKYQRQPGSTVSAGYVGQGKERLTAYVDAEHGIKEIRESFDISAYGLNHLPPTLPLPTFAALYQAFWDLGQKILDCLAVGLDLPDPTVFRRSHTRVAQPGSGTMLRTLWYPAVEGDAGAKDQLTRCGTHSDYGTLTLLFQDSVGGLEVENRKDEFVPATPIPGCVLVNVADHLQRWTADRLRSTRHRVGFGGNVAKQTRQSIAFFLHPDDDVVITCLDGSDKYPPYVASDHLQDRFKRTY